MILLMAGLVDMENRNGIHPPVTRNDPDIPGAGVALSFASHLPVVQAAADRAKKKTSLIRGGVIDPGALPSSRYFFRPGGGTRPRP